MSSEHDTKTPEELARQRVPLERKVSLKFKEFRGFITEYSANISLGGMFIRSETPQAAGTKFDFELGLEDDFTLIQGIGEVVWVRNRAAGADRPPGMGIRFLDLNPESRELIYKIVEEHVRSGGIPFDLEAEAAGGISEVEVLPTPPAAAPDDKTVSLGRHLLPPGKVTWASNLPSDTAESGPDGSPDRREPNPKSSAEAKDERLPAGIDEVARLFGTTEGALSALDSDSITDRSIRGVREAESSPPPETVPEAPLDVPATPTPAWKTAPRPDDRETSGASSPPSFIPPAPRAKAPPAPGGERLPPPPPEPLPWVPYDHDEDQHPEPDLGYGSPMKRPSRVRPLVLGLILMMLAGGLAAYLAFPDRVTSWIPGRASAPPVEQPEERDRGLARVQVGTGSIFERPMIREDPSQTEPTDAGETDPLPAPEDEASQGTSGEPSPSARERPEPGATEPLPPPAAAPFPPATTPEAISPARLTRLEEVGWERQPGGTLVILVADGGFREGTISQFRLGGDTPREVVRIRGVQHAYGRPALTVGTDQVAQVRTGYHPGNELHVVLDLTGPGVALERTEARGNRLLLYLSGS